ncbi:hypothetical protein D9Q98_009970 [Chlorella vulgaris]|uniref:F-box domain-containing protein n=1 Tax=Chlorella vulgaris TaxID=3077 RepID=A0A9D4YSV8_CHLVU|nr:hypothetical protein D9Q98_009970 [Chlorella vulgaris]
MGEASSSAGAMAQTCLDALPEPLKEAIWQQLGLQDLAMAAAVCKAWAALTTTALGAKLELNAAGDLPLLVRQLNFLLLSGGDAALGATAAAAVATGRKKQRLLGYLPAAIHHVSKHCHAMQHVRLELPPPQAPLSAAAEAVAQAAAGLPWDGSVAAAATQSLLSTASTTGCPPVDGYALKLLAQSCPQLRSLRLVNVSSNRLVRANDSCLALLARSCPLLEELVLGHRGGEDCMFNPASPFYLEDLTDAGLKALASHSVHLRSLALLRCSRVADEGLSLVAQMCRQLTCLQLHDCPGISERGLLKVGEHCRQLLRLDCTVARRSNGLLPNGQWEEQLGFLALFTIAANCPLLEQLSVSEEGLEAPVLDDACMLCISHGCRRLRRLELRHCAAVTDAAATALAARCKGLQVLVLEHTGVGDAGLLALARGLPLLHTLRLSSLSGSLARLGPQSGGPHAPVPHGGAGGGGVVSDAGLLCIAQHCTALRDLAITGSRGVTDAGLMHLVHQPAAASASAAAAAAAAAGTSSGLVHGGALEAGLTLVAAQHLQQLPLKPPPQLPPQLLLQHPLAFHSQLTALTINHTAAKDGSVSSLLELCGQLRRLSLRGLLYNADSTVACLAASCRHLTALDLRHCSTLSDSGLAEAARLLFLRSLHLSFCVRITDSGLAQLAAPQGSSRVAGGSLDAQRCARQVVQAESGRGRAALHRGSASLDWHCAPQPAAQAAHRTGSCDVQQLPRPWDAEEQRLPAPPSAAAAAAGDGGWQEAGGSSRGGESLLQELELYHVPQVTHHGIRALLDACPHMQHVNIGKCRQVQVERLLPGPRVRLSACHYLSA